MRYLVTAFIAVVSVFSVFSARASAAPNDPATSVYLPCPNVSQDQVWLPGEGPQHNNLQTHMFDGITLTELQRQQMRDLMQQMQQTAPVVSVDDVEALHNLVIATDFDETAVRTLIEQIAQRQVARQIEMAKVRNRMYHLLDQQQQAILAHNHQLRVQYLQQATHMQ